MKGFGRKSEGMVVINKQKIYCKIEGYDVK